MLLQVIVLNINHGLTGRFISKAGMLHNYAYYTCNEYQWQQAYSKVEAEVLAHTMVVFGRESVDNLSGVWHGLRDNHTLHIQFVEYLELGRGALHWDAQTHLDLVIHWGLVRYSNKGVGEIVVGTLVVNGECIFAIFVVS